MEDRCAHRNAALSKGAVFDGKLGCPYHGWVYDHEGRCVEVPSSGPDAAPPQCGVRRFPAVERHGLVWVWMGDTRPTREPFPMPYWDTPGWGTYYMVTEFPNEVTHLVENFMDVPHTTFVHVGWFREPAHKRVRVVVERTPDSVLVTYDLPNDEIGFTGRILNPDGAPTEHTDKFYMPNTTRVDYTFGPRRGFTITSTCTPRGPFATTRLHAHQLQARLAERAGAAVAAVLHARGHSPGRADHAHPGRQPAPFRRRDALQLDRRRPAARVHRVAARSRGARRRGPAPEPRIDEVFFWI